MYTFMLTILFILLALASLVSWPNHRKRPPGPPSLPIIGNLHMLGNLPHQTLHHFSKKYGPILSLKLGSVPTIVVSSAKAAELFLKTHDTIFASRAKLQATHYLSYGSKGMAFTEYGPYWRSVRKLCTLHLLSSSKIEGFAPIRKEELGFLVDNTKKAAMVDEVVNFSEVVGDLIQKISCRIIFGVSGNGYHELSSLVKEGMSIAGAFNIADFVPPLGVFDLQGLKKRVKACRKGFDKVVDRIIDEHEKEAHWKKNQSRDFVDMLLLVMNQSVNSLDEALQNFGRTNVKALLIEMIVAAFDTSATAIEWTFAELIRHPQVMKKLQHELQNIIGLDKMVDEKDLSKLSYLDMLIKESLRLHPVAPLLVPHESMEDVTINGYYIPKKSRVIVNSYALGRDLDAWVDNVDAFLPERFIGTNIDLYGHDFQLVPFGSGRRGCPGLQLGLTTIRIVIAQLVHCFDWELPNGMLASELDMTEKFGLTLPRASHLLLLPKYRLLV